MAGLPPPFAIFQLGEVQKLRWIRRGGQVGKKNKFVQTKKCLLRGKVCPF